MAVCRNILHAAWNEAVNSRSRAPALERAALEAPASSDNLARQEPREQCVPRLEPRHKDINRHRVKYNVRGTVELGQAALTHRRSSQ